MANRLADATSPYLRQHADNPVDWQPWGPEALAEAVRRDVPLFVSIGYAACHWCHVMAHESFEDPTTAELLNQHFVCIKVDREERPDLDQVYMNATVGLTGRGGWPMSVFCTPDGKPFYAGTYYPPEPRHGMPSFGQLLTALAEAWRDQRPQIEQSSGQIATELQRVAGAHPGQTADLSRAYAGIKAGFDAHRGGFGGAPKFPPTLVLDALLARGGEEAETMVDRTLQAMIAGGIHDQLGGGFARYSVDAGWVVPHFEKMLYDNALLLGTLSRRWGRTRDPRLEQTVRRLVGWLDREMKTAEGGYAASLDADSLGADGHSHEGAFYVWDPAELRGLLGDEAEFAAAAYAVTPAGTFEAGKSTLQRIDAVDEDRLEPLRVRLLQAREQRPRPGRDDKVVAAWNGWLIDALATAAMNFEEPDWLRSAVTAAEFLWRTHRVDGRLRRTSLGGEVGSAAGTLEDYGALAYAFVRLATATGEAGWLDRARELLDIVDAHFGAGDGGWFDTADDAEQLYARPRDLSDNVTPSGTSTTIAALRLLARVTGEPAYDERADRGYASATATIATSPRFAGWLLLDAWSQPAEVAVTDPELTAEAWRAAGHLSVVVTGEADAAGFPVLAGKRERGAYVCRDFVCHAPVTGVAELVAELT